MGEQTVKMNARLMNRLDELDCMEARRARTPMIGRSGGEIAEANASSCASRNDISLAAGRSSMN